MKILLLSQKESSVLRLDGSAYNVFLLKQSMFTAIIKQKKNMIF